MNGKASTSRRVELPAHLKGKGFLSEKQILELRNVSRATIRREIDKGTFPPPIVIGYRLFWPEEEWEEWRHRTLEAMPLRARYQALASKAALVRDARATARQKREADAQVCTGANREHTAACSGFATAEQNIPKPLGTSSEPGDPS